MKCYICGQELPEESFYSSELKARSPRCKDCHKARKRELKKRKGTVSLKGIHLVVNEGKSRSIYWTSNMVSELKRYYPTTKNAELADLFGVSPSTINRKAKELGLSKDKLWIIGIATENGLYGKALKNKKTKGVTKKSQISPL